MHLNDIPASYSRSPWFKSLASYCVWSFS
jgi:hypothetical protein